MLWSLEYFRNRLRWRENKRNDKKQRGQQQQQQKRHRKTKVLRISANSDVSDEIRVCTVTINIVFIILSLRSLQRRTEKRMDNEK